MSREPGWWQLPCGLPEHGLDSLDWLGGDQGRRAPLAHLVSRLQGGGQVHQSLDLDAVPGAHVSNVVEVGGSTDHLGATVRISKKS